MFINNPYGYVPNIAALRRGLKPGGRIIVQGSWEANKWFRRLGTDPVPEGMHRLPVERNAQILGERFSYTSGQGSPRPDTRIIFEVL